MTKKEDKIDQRDIAKEIKKIEKNDIIKLKIYMKQFERFNYSYLKQLLVICFQIQFYVCIFTLSKLHVIH